MIDILELKNKNITSITEYEKNLFIVADGEEYCLEPSFVENIRFILIINSLSRQADQNTVKHIRHYQHDDVLSYVLEFTDNTMTIIIDFYIKPKNYNINLMKVGDVSIVHILKIGHYDNATINYTINRFMVSELTKLNTLIGKNVQIDTKDGALIVETDKNERFTLSSTNGKHGTNVINDVKIISSGPILSLSKCIHDHKVFVSLITKEQIVPIVIPYKRINSFKINIEEGYNLI